MRPTTVRFARLIHMAALNCIDLLGSKEDSSPSGTRVAAPAPMAIAERLSRHHAFVRLMAKYGCLADGQIENPSIDPQDSGPEQFATDLEALGPTFIKLGQVLSPRADLLPPAYLDAVARLQDNVAPFCPSAGRGTECMKGEATWRSSVTDVRSSLHRLTTGGLQLVQYLPSVVPAAVRTCALQELFAQTCHVRCRVCSECTLSDSTDPLTELLVRDQVLLFARGKGKEFAAGNQRTRISAAVGGDRVTTAAAASGRDAEREEREAPKVHHIPFLKSAAINVSSRRHADARNRP